MFNQEKIHESLDETVKVTFSGERVYLAFPELIFAMFLKTEKEVDELIEKLNSAKKNFVPIVK